MSTDAWSKDIFDNVDSSVTRSDVKFRALFDEAGFDSRGRRATSDSFCCLEAAQ